VDSKEDLKLALAEWLEDNLDEFYDHDDAYEQLNEIFQPILNNSPVAI
jgi:hypothetical protein